MKKQCTKINERRTVVVVDDDSHVLRAVERLIRSAGFDAMTFESAELLVTAEAPKTNTCLLLDVHMPGMNGVELFERLAADGRSAPVIMMTGRSDDPDSTPAPARECLCGSVQAVRRRSAA